MDDQSEQKAHKWVAWSGPIFIVFYTLGWFYLGHNYPAPTANISSTDLVTNYYLKYHSDIQLGMCITALFGITYTTWTCLVSVLMLRREKSGLLALIQFAGGLLTGWVLLMCPAMWAFCATAAGTMDPDIIKMVHSVAWNIFDMTTMITTIQCYAFAAFVLMDRRSPAMFPAWVGWLSIASGTSMFTLPFGPYFGSGILSYNGLLGYWDILVLWGLYFIVVSYYVFKELGCTPVSATYGVGHGKPPMTGPAHL